MKNLEKVGCHELNLRKTARFLKQNDNYIILTHTSPDGDTLGSAYALYYGLKKMGKTAMVLCPDAIPEKFAFFMTDTDTVNEDNAVVVAVDVADAILLGDLKERFGDNVDLNIDHHISNKRFAKNLYLDATASATCEMIFNLLHIMKTDLDDITAKALYTGIATDTGCFKYSNVTAQTHEIAAKLYAYNIGAADITKLMFDTKSKKILELERMVLDSAEYHFENRCMILTVTEEMQQKTGCSGPDLEGISVISQCVEGVKVGITVKQTDKEVFRLSVRTYEPLDASVICKRLGGGGHRSAAGATLNGEIGDVKKQLLDVVAQAMEEAYAGVSATE